MTDATIGEHQRTIAIAEVALRQIKALRLPATPRNFESWFVYACGHNSSLNETINDIMARNGSITTADLDQIYDSYFSVNRLADKTDQLGSLIKGQIEEIIVTIGAAAGDASEYSETLAQFGDALAH